MYVSIFKDIYLYRYIEVHRSNILYVFTFFVVVVIVLSSDTRASYRLPAFYFVFRTVKSKKAQKIRKSIKITIRRRSSNSGQTKHFCCSCCLRHVDILIAHRRRRRRRRRYHFTAFVLCNIFAFYLWSHFYIF